VYLLVVFSLSAAEIGLNCCKFIKQTTKFEKLRVPAAVENFAMLPELEIYVS